MLNDSSENLAKRIEEGWQIDITQILLRNSYFVTKMLEVVENLLVFTISTNLGLHLADLFEEGDSNLENLEIISLWIVVEIMDNAVVLSFKINLYEPSIVEMIWEQDLLYYSYEELEMQVI